MDLDEHFDVIALMLEPSASCCVCLCVWGGGAGHVALKIKKGDALRYHPGIKTLI